MKWFLAVVIFIHGVIHLLGAVNELGLAKVEAFSNKTLFLIPHNIHPIFGVFWFITVVAFLIAVFGLVTDRQWWSAVTIGAVIVSQILIFIWWPDAKWGTIVNVLIIIGGGGKYYDQWFSNNQSHANRH